MSGEIALGEDLFRPGPDGYWDMLSRFSADGYIRFDGSEATERRWRQLALALDEIKRLRALTAEQAMVHDAWLAERNLADQLAEALGNSHDDPDGRFNRQAVSALAVWQEARREW